MDEVDAAFILPSNSQQSYKQWSSSVAPVPDFTMGFDSVIKGFEDVARGFDEVDASLPPVSDVFYSRELETVKLTEERASTGDGWALVGPAELALQLRAGLDRVGLTLCLPMSSADNLGRPPSETYKTYNNL